MGIATIIVMLSLTACEKKQCNDGDTRQDSYRENTYVVCVDGKWETYTNPDKPDHRTDI